MLIVFIISAVFHGATSMNNSQTLLLMFKNNIQSRTLLRYPKILRHEFSANPYERRNAAAAMQQFTFMVAQRLSVCKAVLVSR